MSSSPVPALPPLQCPFPAAMHRHVVIAESSTLAWADRFGLTSDPAVRCRLRATRSARLAGRVGPRATLQGLLLNTDWQTWLFLFDDAFCDESESGSRPTAVIGLTAQVLTVMDTGEAPERATGQLGPFLASLADLLARLARMATPIQMARFTAEVTGYLLALTWEAAHRETADQAGLAEYRVMRRHSGAVYPCLALIDVINGFELSARLWHRPSVHALNEAVADLICWANDIFSYPKEIRRSAQVSSLPTILARERGLSITEALREAALMHDERVREYQALETPLLAEADPPLVRYLADLRAWLGGHLAWSQETGRYGLGMAA